MFTEHRLEETDDELFPKETLETPCRPPKRSPNQSQLDLTFKLDENESQITF